MYWKAYKNTNWRNTKLHGRCKEFSRRIFALNLSVGIFSNDVQKTYSSFYINESFLQIDKNRIIKSDYWSKLIIYQKPCFKKWQKIKLDAFKHVEGTQYESPKSSTSRFIHIIRTKHLSRKMSASEGLKKFCHK